MTMRRVAALVAAAGLWVAAGGCSKPAEHTQAAAGKHYPMTGEIVALNAKEHTATIQHGPIGDWMEAMTMDYPVRDQNEFQRLRVGEKIQATVNVNGTDYDVSGIKEQAAGNQTAGTER